MKKISILIILPSFAGGGAERVTLSFIKYLDSNAFDYNLMVINNEGPLQENINKDRVIYVKNNRLRNSFIEILSKIKLINPDVIFSTFPHISLPLIIAKKCFIINSLVISREPNMVKPSLNNSSSSIVLRILYKFFMPSADKIIVSSKAMYDDLFNRKIDKKRLHLIHNPIDHLKLRKVTFFYRHPGKGLRLVAMGRLVYQKGFDRLIPMLREINNVHLTILGEGPEYNKLSNISKTYNLEKKITFKGYINNSSSYIAAADYFILPSRWEGLPNSALESLALGTPVISFNEVVGLLDIIKISKKDSIRLCENDEEMKKVLKKLPIRYDSDNILLRKNLLQNFNTPIEYAEKICSIIKEALSERKN